MIACVSTCLSICLSDGSCLCFGLDLSDFPVRATVGVWQLEAAEREFLLSDSWLWPAVPFSSCCLSVSIDRVDRVSSSTSHSSFYSVLNLFKLFSFLSFLQMRNLQLRSVCARRSDVALCDCVSSTPSRRCLPPFPLPSSLHSLPVFPFVQPSFNLSLTVIFVVLIE